MLDSIGGDYEFKSDVNRRYTSGDEIELKCKKCDYEFKTTIQELLLSVQKGIRKCPRCNKKERVSDLDAVKYIEANRPIKVLEFKNKHERIKCQCLKCGKITDRYYQNIFTSDCKYCSGNGSSNPETEILEYLTSLDANMKIISHDRSVLSGVYELDFYVPEKKLAIEYDGLYYHSSDKKDSKYHLSKTKGCEQQGIQLLHIFENEWLDPVKNDIWKSVISHKLGCNSVIYARNTVVREISSSDCYAFCEQNHLQGGCRSSKNLGLFTKEDELVAIMSFRKPRFNPAYDWELIRYCSKKYVSVVGGASKLLKHFRKLNSGSIISYANRRWSTGDLYEALGFSFVRETAPNYFYYKTLDGVTPENLELHSRLEFQKHKLASKIEHFDANKSEFENMYQNGYRSIYDCGNLVYVLK